MFSKLMGKRAKETPLPVVSPIAGKAVPIAQVPDPTFAEEILGKSAAIIPSEGKVVSPIDGVVEMIFETGHAVSLRSGNDMEILIHVGVDTVKLGGKHYVKHVSNGDTVKKGDLLIEFDIEGIQADGYNIITPIIICNSADYKKIEIADDVAVQTLDPLITAYPLNN